MHLCVLGVWSERRRSRAAFDGAVGAAHTRNLRRSDNSSMCGRGPAALALLPPTRTWKKLQRLLNEWMGKAFTQNTRTMETRRRGPVSHSRHDEASRRGKQRQEANAGFARAKMTRFRRGGLFGVVGESAAAKPHRAQNNTRQRERRGAMIWVCALVRSATRE